MQWTETQTREMVAQGYTRFPGVIPPELVGNALRAINGSLGENGIDPAQLTKFRAQSYAPEVQRTPAITDLFNASPLASLAEAAIGAGQVQPVEGGQIALRFPKPGAECRPAHPHLDGMYSPSNGVPEGTIRNFTALVGVFLSDVPTEYAGNLSVWPGTHVLYERYFREHGPQSLLNGMPPIDMPEPVQITARAGDAVLCHYQIAHGITVNTAPHTRYAIFFRLKRVGHEERMWDCMTDIWLEWDGVRAAATAIAP